MENVGENGGSESANESGKPEKIVVVDNKVSEDGIKAKVENGNGNSDDEVASGVVTGGDVGGEAFGNGFFDVGFFRVGFF